MGIAIAWHSVVTRAKGVTMKNVERFNLYTAHIFGVLYDQFPIARKVDEVEIVKQLNLEPRALDEKPNEATFVVSTVRWLTETGYLFEYKNDVASRYVLSPKAFEALNATLSSLQGKKSKPNEATVGERLAEVAVGGKPTVSAAGVTSFPGALA